MTEIKTDVLIVGTGPAGSSTAALLSSYGIDNVLINNYSWLSGTPRAHITNQRTMEVLRDLGKNVETEAYLHMFKRLLPELKLDDIRCHVGDLGQAQFDQTQVASLAKDWHLLTPEGVHQNCMPAFLHRVSRIHAVLVLYVSSAEGLELLNRIPGADWLVKHLHKQRSELQDVLQKISFVPRPELDLEQVRLRSFVLGDIPLEKSVVEVTQESSSLTVESSKTSISAQQQFAKISRQLRAKPADTQT